VAARQFDATFMQMMLKSMRDATPSDGVLDSDNGKMYTSMLDQQLSQELSSKGVGLANAMIGQLLRNAGTASGAAGSATAAGAVTGAVTGAGANTAGALAYAKSLRGRPLDPNGVNVPRLRGTSNSTHANDFVDKLAAPAQAASAATGIPARFIVGQAALESGWGRHEIKNYDGSSSHNVFGIKAGKDWTGPTVEATTTEYQHGVAHKVSAKFRSYGSYQDAMVDYAKLLKSNPRYQPVIQAAADPAGFANGMQRAGYATDPQYAKKLITIMNQMA
jgi:flagellar protein FlgJ